MKETYTSAEARAALRVDAKTFLRWLKQAGMEPQVSKADHRIKVFTHEQIERLADEHERSLQGEHLLSTDERIAALERRVSELEATIAALSTTRLTRSPRATSSSSATNSRLPDGYIPITDLIKQHHAPETSVMRHMSTYLKRGRWKTSDGRTVNNCLDPEGRAEFERRYGRA